MSFYGVIKVTVLTAQHRDRLLDLIQTFKNGSCPHQLPSLLSPMLNIHTIVLFLDQHSQLTNNFVLKNSPTVG